jgi:chromosomal replication initiator protein
MQQTEEVTIVSGLDIRGLWDESLEIIRGELNTVTFKTWFQHAEPLAMDGDVLVVGASNAWGRDWLENRYSGLLSATLTQVAGRPIGVRFVVSGEPAVEEVAALEEEEPLPPQPIVVPVIQTAEETPERQAAANAFNSRYTFDSFIVGESNRFAYHVALAVAESPGSAYNPLFIYGGVGLGKTHLMQAIGHYVRQHHPRLRVKYVTTERLMNDFIESVRTNDRMDDFRARYRQNDLLLVDDIQVLIGKKETQEEFFHTFNDLYEHGRQIVLTCDRPPQDLVPLHERLISRFQHAGPVDIQPPELETRVAILRAKVGGDGVPISDDVLMKRPIVDVETAQEVLRDTLPDRSVRPIPLSLVKQEVCKFYQIPADELVGSKRSQSIVYPRQIAMYLARELTDLSLPRIGAEFGGRDHTTVMHAFKKIAKMLSEQREVYNQVQALTNTIRQKV